MNNWYWKCLPWFCLVLFCVGQPVSASENGSPLTEFQEASSAYSSGDYGTAIEKFEDLCKTGLSAPLLYNLANSYAQNGQSGKAILNYERALRLAPGNSDIRGNLALIRKKQGLFQEEKSIYQKFAGYLSLNQWIALATCAFVVFSVVLLFPIVPGLRRTTRLGAAACCLFITAVALFGTFGRYQHWYDGVVVAPDARLLVSPFESAASIGTIQEGRVLHMGKVKTHGNYFLVEDETGRSGWLAAESFETIATP